MNISKNAARNYTQILIGLITWLLFISFAPRASGGLFATIENLLLLAVLVLVPLALHTLNGEHYQMVLRIHPLAALPVLIAFTLPQSWLAGMLTLPWLGLALTLIGMRLHHLWHNGIHSVAQFWIDAGTLYLAVGAGWIFLTRSGIQPLDFSAVIVVLTAVHFHYTGFLIPAMLGLADRFLQAQNMRTRLDICAAIGIVSSMPIVALGITAFPLIELIGVTILYGSILIFAHTTGIRIANKTDSIITRWLLRISAAAMIFAISCALLYGIGEYLHMQLITLPRMVQLHGFTNAFGFILCGFLAWNWHGHERTRTSTIFRNYNVNLL